MPDTLTSTEYNNEITSFAEEAVKMCRAGEINDADELWTWVHEAIDGHQWVIYTAYNFEVLAVSSNDGAYVDEYGADGLTKDGVLNTAAMAYAAMEADLQEELHRTDDFDPNDEDSWQEDEEEEEEAS